MNYVLDRNIYICNILLQRGHKDQPTVEHDVFYGDDEPELPHTVGSMKAPNPDKPPRFRFAYTRIPKSERMWYVPAESEPRFYGMGVMSKAIRDNLYKYSLLNVRLVFDFEAKTLTNADAPRARH